MGHLLFSSLLFSSLLFSSLTLQHLLLDCFLNGFLECRIHHVLQFVFTLDELYDLSTGHSSITDLLRLNSIYNHGQVSWVTGTCTFGCTTTRSRSRRSSPSRCLFRTIWYTV